MFQFMQSSVIHFIKSYFYLNHFWFAFRLLFLFLCLSSSHATSEHLINQIKGVSRTLGLFKSFCSLFVINVTLFRVGKDLVGFV